MKKMGKVDNQGFSLVEIIIVVAILAILGSMTIVGLGALTSKPVTECTRRMQIALDGNRNSAMGKKTSSILIYLGSDGSIMAKETLDTSERVSVIGQNSVQVKYVIGTGAGAEERQLTSSGILIQFDRSDGSLKAQVGGLDNGKYVKKFIITRGADTRSELIIDALTGRVTIE